MQLRKWINSLIITTVFCNYSVLANAENITLSNQSNHTLSFNMNNDATKATAFIAPGSNQIIDEATFKKYCLDNNNYCELEIFMSNPNKVLANVIFEGTTIMSVSNNVESEIWVTGHGSHIVFANK